MTGHLPQEVPYYVTNGIWRRRLAAGVLLLSASQIGLEGARREAIVVPIALSPRHAPRCGSRVNEDVIAIRHAGFPGAITVNITAALEPIAHRPGGYRLV